MDIERDFNNSLSRVVWKCVDGKQLSSFLDGLVGSDGSRGLVEDRVGFFDDGSNVLSDGSVLGLGVFVDLAMLVIVSASQ